MAIVGAGSAGVAAARDLAEFGYPVTIYEMYPAPGGTMIGGIPIWRLPREVTREEVDEYLDALGVEVKLNTLSVGMCSSPTYWTNTAPSTSARAACSERDDRPRQQGSTWRATAWRATRAALC